MAATSPDVRNESWKRNPIVRFFASVTTGVTLLFLVLAYACVFSALPQVRGAVEVTEMQAFSHWTFTTLTALLCVSVIVATLARIPFNLINLGVWCVHAGILILCGGAIWYFGTKIEGDVVLRSPRLELVATGMGAGERSFASLLPEKGQTWENFMPAFGGRVALEVMDAAGAGGSVDRVTVRAKLGDAEPKDVVVSAATPGPQPINERMALRLRRFPAEHQFYDRENAALWYRKLGAPEWNSAPLKGLPYFRERYLDEGYTLRDSLNRDVPSKRTQTEVKLAGITIPTGWFEHWRMPIKPQTAGVPFDVEVTGFVPYVSDMRELAVGGGDALNPGLNLRISVPGTDQVAERSMFALKPARAWLDFSTPIEFRWVDDPAERAALLRPMAGSAELEIEVLNPPVKKTLAIKAGQTIEIEGTPYRLTVKDLPASWPLMSPGFEGAVSPAATVEIATDARKITRTVIQRFPQFTQDVDEKGVRKRDGLVDANIVLKYRNATNGSVLLLGDAEGIKSGTLTLAVFGDDGKVEQHALQVDKPHPVSLGGLPVMLDILDLYANARGGTVPVIEPLESRRPGLSSFSASAIRVKLTGKDKLAGWTDSQWIEFSQYAHVDQRPVTFRTPGGEAYELVYSREAHDLGVALTPQKLTVKFFPGKRSVDSWRSWFYVQPDGGGEPKLSTVYTNQTCAAGRWTLFQSGAATDHWSYTILGVGNRRGIWPMVLGCLMIPLGSLWAFYVKPALKRRAAERVLEAERNRRPDAATKPTKAARPEVVHAG